MTVLSIDEFRAALRRGERPAAPVQRLAVAEAIPVEDASRKITLCFSDGSVDRMGDRISPQGWDLAAYKRNAVVLWSHDALSPPIGRASNIHIEGDRLIGDVEFAAAEVYPFADQIYRLVRARFLNACSVGFRPLEYSFSRDPARPLGVDFRKQELLEVSICPIPANAGALVDGRSARLSCADDRVLRAATIERLRPRELVRPKEAASFDDRGLMPPNFCGVWLDYQREREKRDQQQRIRRLLRLAVKSRPETLAGLQAVAATIGELRALEEAWR